LVFVSARHGSLSSAPSRNLLNMTPDPRGYKFKIVGTRSPNLTLSYWVNPRSVALDLFPHPWPIPCILDIPCFLLSPSPDPTHFPLSAYFLCGHTLSLSLPPSLIQRVTPTRVSVCSQLLTRVHNLRIIPPWRWRRYVPPKRRFTLPELYTAPHLFLVIVR
jgi:hypothetical protein